jgi:hypothetical protein
VETLAVAALILAIVAGALALLLPRDYLHFAVLTVSVAASFLAAAAVF